jgi:hypothetical protein|nr:MAG TPA: hypothetical protein [Caudoviricetes sp.]
MTEEKMLKEFAILFRPVKRSIAELLLEYGYTIDPKRGFKIYSCAMTCKSKIFLNGYITNVGGFEYREEGSGSQGYVEITTKNLAMDDPVIKRSVKGNKIFSKFMEG